MILYKGVLLIIILSTSIFANVSNPYENISDDEKLKAVIDFCLKKYINIPKPSYPPKPTKPKIKSAQTIVKDMFETTEQFELRVKKIQKERNEYLNNLKKQYENDISKYNKEVRIIQNHYNTKVKKIKDYLDEIIAQAINKAYSKIYKSFYLKSTNYDADSQIYYGKILSSKGSFEKNIAINMPPQIARKFYNNPSIPEMVFSYQNEKLSIKDISVDFDNKNYKALALALDTEYETNIISKTIIDKKLNFEDVAINDYDSNLEKLNNSIQKIDYSKNNIPILSQSDIEKLKKSNQTKDTSLEILLHRAKKSNPNPKAYAIIFGIEDYMFESDVSYSTNSALMFTQYANKILGVPDSQIWSFIGSKSQSGYIKSQWNNFLNLIEDDSVVYFYYSGHGIPDNKGFTYILPSDLSAQVGTSDDAFKLQNIYKSLENSQAKRVVAFVDSCFSGKDENGKLLLDGIAPVLMVKKFRLDSSKTTVFSAGNKDQFSNQYKEEKHRLFSYFLMKGLAENKIDIQELFDYVKKEVGLKSKKLGDRYLQIPQISGKIDGLIK
jgi:hypothetical protein